MTKQITIPIPFAVDAQALENIKNSLPYTSRAVVRGTISADGKTISLEVNDGEPLENVQEKVANMLERLRPLREDADRTVWKREPEKTLNTSDIFGELVARGDALEHTPGIFSFSGRLAAWMEGFERHVLAFATRELAASQLRVPISTPITDLDAIHFFDRTPQFAQFMCGPAELTATSAHRSGAELVKNLGLPTHMCRSAICLNVYPRYRGRRISGEGSSFTVYGHAFRNEASNVTTLERLHEFTMREVVCIGEAPFVQARLQRCLEWFKTFFSEVGVHAEICLATDSFFADNATALQFHQLSTRAKLEARVLNPRSGNWVSVGSLNNHVDHFSRAFDIGVEGGGRAVSGCVGWGVERMVFTLLAQRGLNPVTWPKAMREAFGEP